jgi:hypothetical protein
MSASPRFCSHCGAQLAPEMRYCGSCGQPVVPGDKTPAAEVRPQSAKKRGSLAPLLIGVLAFAGCACVVIAGIVVWAIFSPNRTAIFPRGLPVPGISEVTPVPSPVPVSPETGGTQPALVQPTNVLPAATERPTETTVPVDPALIQVDYQGIQFTYHKDLASQVVPETIPAQSGVDVAPWDIYPEHVIFDFTGYPVSGSMHKAQMFVYPIADYIKLDPSVQSDVDSLRNLLLEQPADGGSDAMPFLPRWNAGQVFHAQVRYFGDQGVRYLTLYAQDLSPINNEAIFYTYQGFSADGQYYIAAIFPVNHPSLPATYEIPNGDYDAFVKDYQAYLDETTTKLEGEKTGSFLPSLDLLDRMMSSLVVTKGQ